jgi:hypothetical protein
MLFPNTQGYDNIVINMEFHTTSKKLIIKL